MKAATDDAQLSVAADAAKASGESDEIAKPKSKLCKRSNRVVEPEHSEHEGTADAGMGQAKLVETVSNAGSMEHSMEVTRKLKRELEISSAGEYWAEKAKDRRTKGYTNTADAQVNRHKAAANFGTSKTCWATLCASYSS